MDGFPADRYGTIVTAHDFALHDKDIKRRLPCHNDYFTNDKFTNDNPVETRYLPRSRDLQEPPGYDPSIDLFGLYFEVLEILSRVHEFLRRTPMDVGSRESVYVWMSECNKIKRYLASWLENLPPAYGSIGFIELGEKAGYASREEHEICAWVMLHATYHA